MISRKRIFLASSGELAQERDLIELLIHRKNSSLIDKGVFLDVVRWEELLHAFHEPRIQDRFSALIPDCDVIIVLFHTKVGQFTKEEFDIAYRNFKSGINPRHIIVYFKNTLVSIDKIDAAILRIREMKDEIQHDQQIFVDFTNLAELELSLGKQLEILASLFEREISYLSFPESAILSEASKMPTEEGIARQLLAKDEVRRLAESVGLFKDWRVNPHLTFEEGDVFYFWERRISRVRLEAQLRARRLVLEKAEEIDLVIPEPGDLSEKAKPIELRLLAAWQSSLAQKPDANAVRS